MPVVPAHPSRQILNGIYHPKGPLFLLHEVSRTEALLCAHHKACNRRPMWRSASLTTNSKRSISYISFLIRAKLDLMHTHFLYPFASKFFLLKKSALVEISAGCEYTDVCIQPFLCPQKKALAICVQSHNCSALSVLLLFISRHVLIAILY